MTTQGERRWHVCNFGPDEDAYYNRAVNIAEHIGIEAWINEPVFERGGGSLPQMKGFYAKESDLSHFWDVVYCYMRTKQ